MKVSAIKTVIQKPARRLLPYAIGAMALVGCTYPTNKINDYCRYTDKTIKQYREYVNRNEDISGLALTILILRNLRKEATPMYLPFVPALAIGALYFMFF